MKRIHPILRILFFLIALCIVCISSQAATPARSQVWCRDVYADRQEKGEIIISAEDTVLHSFYEIKKIQFSLRSGLHFHLCMN